MKAIQKIICLLIVLCLAYTGFAQDLLSGSDLSKVRVDEISDAQIAQYQQKLLSSGMTQAQAEQLAVSRGFPASEVVKLRQRLANAQTNQQNAVSTSSNKRTPTNIETVTSAPMPISSDIFGAELFSTSTLSFQPDLKIATPMNYVLGPDDELLVSVSGLQEASFNLTVTPEGTIYIPNVGQIKVSGLTFEGARTAIRNRMSGIYTSLRSGASNLSVSLGKIRSIRVTILGASKPGTYTISSLSTLFNALYQAGGPAANGTFREIELVRNNKVERKVDLYKFLLTGTDEDNVRLNENDVIRIPVYKNRVNIAGQVKRNGVYELLPGETLNDLLRYASGFTDSAYKASIKVTQLTDKEKRVKDIPAADFTSYQPKPGDAFVVSEILNRYQNRVTINGAVFRPGVFELTDNLTVANLIRKADGLREDAYTGRGQIVRLKEDLTKEIIPFNVRDVLNNNGDFTLKREDVVSISSIFDLRDQFSVAVQGEVRKPGSFTYVDSLSLKDVILQAGGFSEAAYPQKIEIARVIRRDTLTASDVRLSQIINVSSLKDLSLTSNNIPLQPFDVVTVRRMPGFLELKSVTASGQVQYPGPFVLSTREERISDLLKRAGGFTPEAFADGAYLRRLNEKDQTASIEVAKVEKIQEQLKDSTAKVTAEVSRPYDQIAIDLNYIIAHPGVDEDLVLKPGDELYVPRNDEQIKISGEIMFPTQVPFKASKGLEDYVDDAGGFTGNAVKKKIYVLYPNGKAARTSHFLFVRNYPKVKPGSEIIIPRYIEKEKRKMSTAETLGLTSALVSLAGVVIAILQVTK